LRRPEERELIDRIGAASDDFMRLDDRAWAALQAGRTDEVKRLFLGPELEYFGQAAAAAEALAKVEQRRESQEERRFENARHDALRLLILSAIVASLLVGILLVTANDLAREADRRLHSGRDEEERTDGGEGG
jgi:methyl-accepting chemotaxis protein